ncbi:hypothetical protein DPEC_G00359460 [Dallia pectoralis]|uniref:Uncharacterized protein n=1 Tax=Dallia pectoralis TaxID=75939 RepID=A0ACC2F0T1_DALPE|nr:hypothetical protein DPEC_G00359460 [Dallia pectoralis]
MPPARWNGHFKWRPAMRSAPFSGVPFHQAGMERWLQLLSGFTTCLSEVSYRLHRKRFQRNGATADRHAADVLFRARGHFFSLVLQPVSAVGQRRCRLSPTVARSATLPFSQSVPPRRDMEVRQFLPQRTERASERNRSASGTAPLEVWLRPCGQRGRFPSEPTTVVRVRHHRQGLDTHWEKRKHSAAPSDTGGQGFSPSHCRQLRRYGPHPLPHPHPPSAIILKPEQLAGVRSYKGPSVHGELSPPFPRSLLH